MMRRCKKVWEEGWTAANSLSDVCAPGSLLHLPQLGTCTQQKLIESVIAKRTNSIICLILNSQPHYFVV